MNLNEDAEWQTSGNDNLRVRRVVGLLEPIDEADSIRHNVVQRQVPHVLGRKGVVSERQTLAKVAMLDGK